MTMSVVNVETEEVDVSMAKDVVEDMGGDVDKVEEETAVEVVEEAAACIKMGLTYHMSPVTLKIWSGIHS